MKAEQIRELAEEFRKCSINPRLGMCKINRGGIDEKVVDRFLDFLADQAEAASGAGDSTESGLGGINGSGVNWRRISRRGVFPLYLESLTITADDIKDSDGFPVVQHFPGTWSVAAAVLDESHELHYAKNADRWSEWIRAQVQGSGSGGLSFNVIDVPGEALKENQVDVRPLTMHAISPDGRGVDRGDVHMQAAIANAFWQTFWATGATRTERGSVFPVAFLPIDRSSKFEFAEPFHERYVSLRRRLFGRSAIVGYTLEVLTQHKALIFDRKSSRFAIVAGFDPASAELMSMDIILAVGELNRTGFVDAYTGDNAELFAAWKDQESAGELGQPWPWEPGQWNHKVKASKHEAEDALEKIRAVKDSDVVVISRVVPYAGCAFLYQVVSEREELIRRGKIQDFEGEPIVATNSTFFLNFPEEYCALHSAMNEPVALLVENGETRQIKTFKRATFVLSESGEPMITTRAGNKLNSEVLVFEGESSSTNYFENAEKSFRENRFGPLFFGAAVVGNAIVETFEEMATEVPPAGWLTGDSEAFGGRINPENAASAQLRQPGQLEELAIRHAFAIGPLLLQDGTIVPLEESREEFSSIRLNQPLSFEKTSKLTRTQLPDELLDCPARGVPPSRFPYDWNVTRAPRSAIGIRDDGSVVIAVVDGRADITHSVGATLAELAVIMKSLGCRDAMNMDGGGSSVMFVNSPDAIKEKLRDDLRDGIVSLPSDMGGVERLLPVPLVVYKRG